MQMTLVVREDKLNPREMDGFSGKPQESERAAVASGENEAESKQEDKCAAREHLYLDACPVCQLSFHSREPKLLPCLHSFCKKCVPAPSRSLAATKPSSAEADSSTNALNVIRCPVCRQECMTADVTDNVFMKDSAEAPSSTVERTVQLCMTCDDNNEAAGFCADCAEYLCAVCVEAHQRVKLTKDHVIRERTEVQGVSAQRPMLCDIHRQEPLKLFCETCDVLTCRDCQLGKHKDHNYQFLEDAFNDHKQHVESLSRQLQEKKKQIEEMSDSISSRLLLVDKNRASVHNEIRKSISSAILEINKKGKILFHQLETVTKDHERVLRKQQEDIGYLSRHLDHVISFMKWATARNGGTALLYCKRLVLSQTENLLRAKCGAAFIPQSTVRFRCRASYWASDVDLGSLVLESVPGHQHGGSQGTPHQSSNPGRDSSDSASFVPGAPQHHSTLALLQMQVDKLSSQSRRTPQPPRPPWTWCQSVPLQRTVPGPLQHLLREVGGSSSKRTTPVDVSSSSSYTHETPLPVSRGVRLAQQMDSVKPVCPLGLQLSSPTINVQGQQNSPEYAFVPQEEKPGTVSWNSPETHRRDSGAVGSAVRKRRRSSTEPAPVIKDEPVDD